jgi:hypothetical protein
MFNITFFTEKIEKIARFFHGMRDSFKSLGELLII